MKEYTRYFVGPGQAFDPEDHDTSYVDPGMDKKEGKKLLKKNRDRIVALQDKFHAHDRYSMLLVFQALDAAGKDSTVKHVFREVRPQGMGLTDFLPPSMEENRYDYLWRVHRNAPARGMIRVFNRSHYEEVTTTRVHPEYVLEQKIPGIKSTDDIGEEFWERRYRQINDFERMLAENGTVILKFFLHVSERKQSKRFLKRLNREDKHWKFSEKDIAEQELREEYLFAYGKAIRHTSTEYAPWYVIPADRKWFMRYLVSGIVMDTLENLPLEYPGLPIDDESEVENIKKQLEKQDHSEL